MSDLIRVLIADDHHVVRRGLATLIVARNGMHVVGEAADGHEAIVKARHLRPDVILMDLIMPRVDGLEAIRAICADEPAARILVLTSFDDDNHVSAAIRSGALGFLRKDSTTEDLLQAIRITARGTAYLPQEIVQKLIRELQNTSAPMQSGMTLTERELDVLSALGKGMSNREIADTLYISPTTVRTHMRNLLGKLGVKNRTNAALYAVEMGISNRHILIGDLPDLN